MIDGVFAVGEDGQVHFAEAGATTPEELAAVQQQVRARVLRWFARAGTLDPADAHAPNAPLRAQVIALARQPPPPRPKWPGTRPPLWDQAPEPLAHWNEASAPVPEYVFDQRLSW